MNTNTEVGDNVFVSDVFWRNTWTVWRSGALRQFGDAFERKASQPYETFSLKYLTPLLRCWLFYEREFLIDYYYTEEKGGASFLLSSHRIWFNDSAPANYISVALPLVARFELTSGRTASIAIHLNDGSEMSFKKLPRMPSREALEMAINRSKTNHGWQDLVPELYDIQHSMSDRFPKLSPESQTAAAGEAFEVMSASGEIMPFPTAAGLREPILHGKIGKNLQIRKCAVNLQGMRIDSDWQSIESFGQSNPVLRDLYRPIWCQTLKYAGYGAIAGIALKAIGTSVVMFAVGPEIGLLWLAAVASLLLAQKWPWAPLLVIVWCLWHGFQGNMFYAVVTTAAVGALLGTPAGMIVGTVMGHFRARPGLIAPDATPEGRRAYYLGIGAPLAALCVLVPTLIWVSYRAADWISKIK